MKQKEYQGEENLFRFLAEMTFLDVDKLRRYYREWNNVSNNFKEGD